MVALLQSRDRISVTQIMKACVRASDLGRNAFKVHSCSVRCDISSVCVGEYKIKLIDIGQPERATVGDLSPSDVL